MRIEEALERAAAPGPVLIAGPTASGKSALALAIAREHGGVVVNADALQVHARWRILTARPGVADEAQAPHVLYGHVTSGTYSVGEWLREISPWLHHRKPIIVGGTGLYFSALTEGLAQIPPTPPMIRAEGDLLSHETLLTALDPETRSRIDTMNRARVQRAWEVLQATGRPLAAWQDDTPPPLLPLRSATAFVLHAPPGDLTPRIERRFDAMLAEGALDEVRANLPDFDPSRPADRAIGAAELVAFLREEIPLEVARDRAVIATRQYAKRQRTWFRARMAEWNTVEIG